MSENNKPQVLCVDDSTFMLEAVSAALGDDYEVFTLSKATAVEKFLQNNMPDLILLDYSMPDINGFELIPIIRKIEAHRETPIIFLSATGLPERVNEAMSLGACDYVLKPLRADILREKLEKHIIRE
ncbi:MAG: response regulator [Oscillospiraceae bacterium]|nr:response regulator [Oscillospiraceae bacterium]